MGYSRIIAPLCKYAHKNRNQRLGFDPLRQRLYKSNTKHFRNDDEEVGETAEDRKNGHDIHRTPSDLRMFALVPELQQVSKFFLFGAQVVGCGRVSIDFDRDAFYDG